MMKFDYIYFFQAEDGIRDADVTEGQTCALPIWVRTLLPDAELTEHVPPPVAELGLRPPRIDPPASLARLCSAEATDRAAHAHGKAFRDVVRNLQGDVRNVPDLVVRPGTEQDVVD